MNGPSPTLDRSYLKKSLLPSQALGLGTAGSRFTRSTAAKSTDVTPAGSQGEEPAAMQSPKPRRVRWQDEDESSSSSTGEIPTAQGDEAEDDDVANFDTPSSIVKAESSDSTGKKGKKDKSKRKSTASIEAGDAVDATDSPSSKRDKKRRKEA